MAKAMNGSEVLTQWVNPKYTERISVAQSVVSRQKSSPMASRRGLIIFRLEKVSGGLVPSCRHEGSWLLDVSAASLAVAVDRGSPAEQRWHHYRETADYINHVLVRQLISPVDLAFQRYCFPYHADFAFWVVAYNFAPERHSDGAGNGRPGGLDYSPCGHGAGIHLGCLLVQALPPRHIYGVPGISVNERYVTRLRRRLQFEERKHANQRRLLSDAETVRWLNHAVEKKKAVMQQLYLGRNPPVFTGIRVLNQSSDDDHLILELGMNFLSADDMSAILAVQLRKRLGFGMWAKMHITGMHIEGRVLVGVKFLRKWPFLGRLRLCFVEPPFFQMTVKPIFSHGLDVTEFPGIAGWLDKLLAIAFEETLVEPNMLVVDVEKFVSSPAEGWFSMYEKSAIAYVKLELLEAADMKPSDLNGLADPYVKGHLGPYRFQTKIQRKTLTPKWLEEFLIPITSWESANKLVLDVRDKDHIFDDTLGDYTVSIGELRGGQRHDMWLALKNIKMGRLHLAITVLEGAAAATVGAAAKVKECGNNEQKDNDEHLKVSEKTTSSEAAESESSPPVPETHMKTADEYEPIDIEGQERTGIWVHRPGSDISAKWEPRKGKNRRPDTELQREDADCTGSGRSMASVSQQSDGGSNDDNPNGNKVHPLGTIKKGVKKIGCLFHKSPRGESPTHSVECALPTPRPNLKEMNERNVAVKLVLDDNLPKDVGKDDAVSFKLSPEQEEAESPGKGRKREMAKGILKQVGKSANQLKSVLSRKGSSKSREGERPPKDVDSSSSNSSTGEESLPRSDKYNFIVDGTSMESASPSTEDKQALTDAEALSANVSTTEQKSSTAVMQSRGAEEDDSHGVDSPVDAKDLKRSPARNVSFRVPDQVQDVKTADFVPPVGHSSESSPRVST
ncbi:hypothetical protein Taro_038984 [Colocasia esculenta]|uniref:C2 domain-containing protein n=1 Tax=Colocasia esculenta TaxID=4460 RepID=A0A843WEE8_COLES|nr:hypothetical protein [Colocasia esculenta]